MVEYGFYTDTYHGASITAEDWPFFESQAQAKLRYFKRIYTVTALDTDSEKMAVCAMADTLAFYTAAQNSSGGPVSSASIGSVSVSYGGTSQLDVSVRAQEKEMYKAAQAYLDIYRGVGKCL